jgi:site-specific DNA-methyltransferase (adenine-specific)
MHTPNVKTTLNYLVGDTREQIATIPDGSISLVATSPPFISLRSYLPADHPMKHAEIGSEPDPATFLDTLLQLTAEWGRVLAPWGSIAIELGDTYAGSGGAGGDYNEGGLRDGQELFSGSSRRAGQWPRPKCLALVPQLYAASLAYGRNLLTGQPSPAGQWLVRNMIVWHRPNPAVGALGDKYRPSTSYITVATRSPKRWFDLTAVRTQAQDLRPRNTNGVKGVGRSDESPEYAERIGSNPAGAPPLDTWFDQHDTWTLTTQPSNLSHYAMWPPKLAERLILSMCPEQVCATCGEPRRRVEKVERTMVGKVNPDWKVNRSAATGGGDFAQGGDSNRTTLGFTDCGHGDNYQPGHVLDPFAGTFTTGLVAEYHQRNATGIDIDERNRDMIPQRREEVRRALNPTHIKPIDGQLDMFGEAAT